jgi:DNA-binding Lrp family transcriptional regulator
MNLHLTKLQKRLCNALQDGLPVCPRPFAELAKPLDTDEETVLRQTGKLKDVGVIQRISALMDYRALGRTGTLAAAHIPQANLKDVTEAVNALGNVSHNYLREHYYNLWFTLQAATEEEIKTTLSNLSSRFGIEFHSLPVMQVFKLNVRFDAENCEKVKSNHGLHKLRGKISHERATTLTTSQKLILSKLQDGLEVTTRPFDFLCGEGLSIEDALSIVQQLTDAGLIRRIAAVVDHRRLGFVANILFVCKVGQDKIVEAGRSLAAVETVSHCYQRGTFEGWPYNLFAMLHGRSIDRIQEQIDEFVRVRQIDSFELLPTAAELKKQPVKYRF